MATLLGGGGVLVAALAITPSSAERPNTAVVTLGPLEAPLPTPRVRVSNDHRDTVDVWYVRVGDPKSVRRLGWVADSATWTFQLPGDADVIRLVVAPGDGSTPLVTAAIDVGPDTDIGVELRPDLQAVSLEVRTLEVIREPLAPNR
jgi:hypothetical protein